LVLVSAVLTVSHFLPYGSDNNESFSAYMHARNLLHFGFGGALGLTDEAYSLDPAAHPYVYTHEGNFPRLPVLLLMRLGLTRVEWQIALLALLVGSAGIYMCFTFFSRIAGNLFAFLVCAVLATDYLSFMQWEVNSFRVWHGFFFFACLLCVLALGGRHARRAGGLFFLTCVALFYFEINFAIFTVATCVCYGLLIYWKQPGLIFRAAVIAGAGAIVALGGLIGQNVAFLGLATTWSDFQRTILNRNFYIQSGGESGAIHTLQFFLQHHIVYWRDNPDTRGYLSIKLFLHTLGKFGVLVNTPYLVWLMWVVTVTWLVRTGVRIKGAISTSKAPGDERVWHRLGLVIFVLFATAGYGLYYRHLYGADFAPIWLGTIQRYFPLVVLLAGLAGAYLLGLIVVWWADQPLFRPHDDGNLMGGFRYLVAVGAGYVCLYVLSPGYLSQGYLVRYVPLAVFIVDVWTALCLYMLIAIAQASHRTVGAQPRTASPPWRRPGEHLRRVVVPHIARGVSLVVLLLAVVYWARIQTVYVTAISPTDYQFMRQLAQPPYRGTTFISDVYAAPIAYFTGAWAYADDLVSEEKYEKGAGGITQLISGDKLWEADRATNTNYLHPQYYICIRTPTLYMAGAFVSLRPGARLSQCSSEPLVRSAREGTGPFHNTVVAEDGGPWDMWAIVKLDPAIRLAFAGPAFKVIEGQRRTVKLSKNY